MLDALEWAVNKTRLGDACSSTGHFLQPALAQDENSSGQVSRQLNRIGDDEHGVAPPHPLGQPSPESRQLQRREVAQVDEM